MTKSMCVCHYRCRPLLRPPASSPGSATGRSIDKGGINMIGMPLTPPVTATPLSAEEKKEIVQTDHFQVKTNLDLEWYLDTYGATQDRTASTATRLLVPEECCGSCMML